MGLLHENTGAMIDICMGLSFGSKMRFLFMRLPQPPTNWRNCMSTLKVIRFNSSCSTRHSYIHIHYHYHYHYQLHTYNIYIIYIYTYNIYIYTYMCVCVCTPSVQQHRPSLIGGRIGGDHTSHLRRFASNDLRSGHGPNGPRSRPRTRGAQVNPP